MGRLKPVVVVLALLSPLCGQTPVPGLEEARKLLMGEHVNEAGEAAARLLAAWPNSGAVRELLGEVHFRQGEIPAAEADFRKTIELEPKTARAWWGLAAANKL